MRRRKQRGRDVHGILLLDKPAGITSNGALQQLKRLMYARKAGHTGSLDPIATGLLPICLGEATKMSAFLLNADKGYDVTIKLGVKTASGDIEGDVISERPVPEISAARLQQVLESFLGDIEQIPPMYSALKRDGQPLYKLARQGIEVEREPRPVTIHELVLVNQTKTSLDLSVLCSKGTYIRTLSEDIGEMLGCGAHVTALRRTRVAGFDLGQAHTFETLEALKLQDYASLDALLLPLDTAVLDQPQLSLSDDLVLFLRQGQPVFVPKAPSQGLVSLYGAQDTFVGVGHILDDGRVAPKRLLVL